MDTGTASVRFAPPSAGPAIILAELERLYRIRISLPPEQRAEVERQYEAYLAGNPPNRAPSPTSAGPESLDPVEAAAFNVEEDPEVGVDLSAYADRPAYSPEGMERAANLPADGDPSGYADRPVYSPEGMERAANMPPAAGPSGYADRSPAYSERNLGRAARGQMPQPRVLQADVDARTRELVGRGIDPESARAIAEVEISNPQDPNDPNPTNAAKKAVIKANVQRFNDGRAAAQQKAEADWYERNFGEGDRLRQELIDADRRGSPDARLHMPETADWRPETAADRKKWKEWTTGGSLDRMAKYAPEEFDRRWNEAAAERKKENDRMRTDPEYRKSVIAKERAQAQRYTPQANKKLVKELEAMGIDSTQFGDWRAGGAATENGQLGKEPAGPQFDRKAALDAKMRARASGSIGKDEKGNPIPIGGREGAVARNAQMRQNPMEFLRRPDITEDQRLATLFYMANGRGPTPIEAKKFKDQMFLEGLQQGARQNLNVNQSDAAAAAAADRRLRGAAAQEAAQKWYQKNVGDTWRNEWNQTRYNSMVTMLQGPPYSLTPEEAAQVAGQFGPPKAG